MDERHPQSIPAITSIVNKSAEHPVTTNKLPAVIQRITTTMYYNIESVRKKCFLL